MNGRKARRRRENFNGWDIERDRAQLQSFLMMSNERLYTTVSTHPPFKKRIFTHTPPPSAPGAPQPAMSPRDIAEQDQEIAAKVEAMTTSIRMGLNDPRLQGGSFSLSANMFEPSMRRTIALILRCMSHLRCPHVYHAGILIFAFAATRLLTCLLHAAICQAPDGSRPAGQGRGRPALRYGPARG
jgi:hypothetical protein